MNKRFWAGIAVLTFGFALAWAAVDSPTKTPKKDDKKEDPKDLFGLTKVLQLDVQVASKEWDKMQPPPGRGFPGGPGGPGGFPGGPGGRPGNPVVPEKSAEKADVHRGGGFGTEFPWAHGELTADGKTVKDIGIRFKGNASYMASSRGLKRNLKIDLDHYNEDLRFHGLKSINLNAGSMDPSKARETLSFAVFRAAGVPAPRTSYAEVTLTVPGKYEKEYLGLYTFIEQVDKTFLKDRFKNGKGLLLKPEGIRGIEYLGDNWDPYKARYRPRHDPSKKESQRLIDFARLIHQAKEEQFNKEIASYLDVDEFLRFIAANALLSNLDSVFTIGHNYYVYLNPETSKFVFIPWDMDLSMASFPMAGGPDQQMDLSLNHPHAGENKLIDRLLAMKDVNTKYQKLLKELATTCFSKEKLLGDIEAIEKATKDITVKEKKAVETRKEGGGGIGFGPPGGGMFGRSTDLRTFVTRRTESILAQLDGKSKGTVPTMGFGPGGPGGRPGGGFGAANFWAKPVLESLDTDKDGKVTKDEVVAGVKKFFKDADKDDKGKLDEKALVEALNRIIPQPGFGRPGGGGPGGFPGGGPGGPGGFPGGGGFGGNRFGPAATIAASIMKRADANKDGLVTLDELVTAAETLFKEADKEKKGKLQEKDITPAIELLLPPPQFGPGGGFGPGGFGPGGFGPMPQPGMIPDPRLQEELKLTDEQKKQLKELQQEIEGKLGKILTDEQKKQLKEIRERGPGGFGPGGFGPGGGGFGPPGGDPQGGRPRPEEPKKP